jgi:hypothetical protein
MTYEELIAQYLAAGGMMPGMQGEGNVFRAPVVTLPDGRQAVMGDTGQLSIYDNMVAGTGSSGGGRDVSVYDPGGGQSIDPYWQANGEGDNWQRSLLGALAVGVGGPALGIAGNALAGLGGAAGAPLGAEGMLAIDGVQGVPGMAGLDGASMAAIDGSALGSSVAQQEALLGAAQGGTAGTTGWGAAAPVAGGGGLTTAGILGGTAGGAGTAGAGFATPTLGGAAAGTGAALGGIGSALASNPALVGAALGGLAGAAGGGDATSTASRDLPAWLQPYAQSYLGRADALSQRPFEAYSGQRVANLSPDQQTAMTQVRDLATVGNPLVNQAQGQQSNVIGGGMLNANPYIDQVAKNIGDRMGEAYATGTRANLASSANMAGGGGQRFNSAAQQVMGNADRSFGDALGSTMSNLYMGNYQNERAAQDAAARGSLNFGNFGRQNTEGLLNVGGLAQGTTQNILNANYDEWQQRQGWPVQNLGILGGAINPGFGQTTTQTDPGSSTWERVLGGALGGAGIARSLYGGQSNSLYGNTPLQSPTFGGNLGSMPNYLMPGTWG